MTAVPLITKGTLVRFPQAYTLKATGAPVDPSIVTLSYTKPGSAQATLTYGVDAAMIKDSVGVYRADILADTEGLWSWSWLGTGAAAVGHKGTFRVAPTEF